MSGDAAGSWDSQLDVDQRLVAGAPCSSLQVVTAGPGTGKTRTLLARARYLMEEEEVERANELLILSFSRAAIEVVSRRCRDEMDIGRLPIRTIDSFAAILLREAGSETAGTSFDARIKLATALLEDDSIEIPRVAAIRHILIDEAQDIVGVRDVFVRRLIDRITRSDVEGHGFTVFGDVAQAIYEFQETKDLVEPGPARFLKYMVGLGSSTPLVDNRELSTNYRMESDRLVELAADFGTILRSTSTISLTTWDEVDLEIADDSGWEEIEDSASAVKFASASDSCSSLAVLCRTNAEVLVIGAKLQTAGIDVRVNHRALDRGGAPWLARMFSRSKFNKANLTVEAMEDPENTMKEWFQVPESIATVLRLEGLMNRDQVDLGRLGDLLRIGACPEVLVARRSAPVVVSTVHRAKGQEFDVVFSVKGRRPDPVRDDVGEEVRVQYVAATRPRRDLCQCPPLDLGGPTRFTDGGDRVMVCSWQKTKRPKQVEVRVSDSDQDWNAGSPDAFRENQERLENRYLPGDLVELRLSNGQDDGHPVYDAWHTDSSGEERIVGRTNDQFGEFMSEYVWGRTPDVISGLSAEIPDTSSMLPSLAQDVGLAAHGLHLRARFFGLGTLEW